LVFGLARYLLSVRYDTLLTEHPIARHLVFLFIVVMTLLALIISIPFSDTVKGQLLALFGILASAVVAFSSTTFVGNAMAGLMLRTVRNFRPGDFLKVGEHMGRISEFGFLHTEIQTEERALTTLPNLYLVTNPVTVIRFSGTIVSADVSLGYENSRQEVEIALMAAAKQAGLAEPFVQVIELSDFSVQYRVAGILTEVTQLITSRSRLREQMLDALHDAGIEIVSPAFTNQRRLDLRKVFIPSPVPVEEVTRPAGQGTPEAVIFDKADLAASAVKMKQKIKDLEDRLTQMKTPEKDSLAESEKARLERRIDSLKTYYKSTFENLDQMKD
jgi:small-conductance mechanosensitive channel